MAHPSTPPRTRPTPFLSSPITPPPPATPSTSLLTPGTVQQHRRVAANVKPEPIQLGYDDMSDSSSDIHMRRDRGALSPPTLGPDTTPTARRHTRPSATPPPPETADQEDDEATEDTGEVLPASELERIKETLNKASSSGSGAGAEQSQLVQMLQSLYDAYSTEVPFLRQQVSAQQATIAMQQQQLNLSKCMMDVERGQFAAERASWQAESQALLRAREAEVFGSNRPKGVLDLDVGYHQELEAANKRLEMDNRLMAPRLVDTQHQIESLVNELRHLRTHVILETSVFDREQPPRPTANTGSTSRQGERASTKVARTTMGDARAEHLLLAAKKVRSLRSSDKGVGRLTLEELQRRGVIGPDGGVGYSEGYGGALDGEDELDPDDEEERKVFQSPLPERASSSRGVAGGTPLLPRPKKTRRAPPTTPSRNRSAPQVPATTPGSSNFNDLLLAAEMATRPGTPTRDLHPSSVTSAARSTTRAPPTGNYESPSKKPRRHTPATIEWSTRRHVNHEGEGSPRRTASADDSQEPSALDLLAQAIETSEGPTPRSQRGQGSASGSGSGSGVLASAARLDGMMEGRARPRWVAHPQTSRSQTPLGPAINLEGSAPSGTEDDTRARERAHSSSRSAPNSTPARGFPSTTATDDPFNDGSAANPSFQSPTGAAVPGLGKYVHLSSTMPARRVRSPYLKWTKEEDELLTRAVMEHGEKWDLVSKCVPTRSYHQVRQRWLRKTGAFDKKPAAVAHSTPNEPSPLGRAAPSEQASPTPRGRKRRER